MGRLTGTTTSKSGRLTGSKTSTVEDQLLQAATEKGYAPRRKVGFLTRLGNVLSSFEPGGEVATAIRSYRKTGNLSTALGEAGTQYGKELVRGLGSAVPFLDKYTNPEDLAANREGFSDALEEAGLPEGEINIAGKKIGSVRGLAGLGLDIVADPGNLALAPVFKGVGKIAGKGGELTAKGLAKTEKGQDSLRAFSTTREALGKALVPGYKVKKISPELADFVKDLERKVNMGDRKAAEQVANLIKTYGEDAITEARKELDIISSTAKSQQDLIKPFAKPQTTKYKSLATQEIQSLIEKSTSPEIELGLRNAGIEGYFPRIVIREPFSFEAFIKGTKPMKPTLAGAEKARVFPTKEAGIEAGYKYLEDPQALASRLAYSQKAQEVKRALNQLIAGEVKDLSGQSIIKKAGKAGTEGLQEFKTIKELQGYVAHPDIVEYLEKGQKVFLNEDTTKDVLKIYDKIQNIWKGSVTSYFPAFHVRNALGNIFNNFIGGVKNPSSYVDAGAIQKGKGMLPDNLSKIFPELKTYEEAREYLAKLGVTGEGQFAVDVTKEMEELAGIAGKKVEKVAGFGRKVGSAIENNARIAHYVEKAKSGLSPKEAAKSVNKFLFDYSDLTPFESNVLKRIMPFYTFSRKNIPLQLEQIYKQPAKYKAVFDAVRGLQSGDLTPEEKKYLPDYLRETFAISVGRGPGGEAQILSGLGLPVEDLEKLGKPSKAFLDMLTPTIKTPIEKATGRSFFYEKDINNTSAYNSTTKAIAEIPGLKQWLRAKKVVSKSGDVYYKVDPNRMYDLKAFLGRFIGTAEKFTDTRKTKIARGLNTLTGLKIYTPDIEQSKKDAIMEMLKEQGLVSTFQNDYVSKDTKQELGL